jgi:hypothetical protein
MVAMILPVIVALTVAGAVVSGFCPASASGLAATWPRRTDRTPCLDSDRTGETAGGHGGP